MRTIARHRNQHVARLGASTNPSNFIGTNCVFGSLWYTPRPGTPRAIRDPSRHGQSASRKAHTPKSRQRDEHLEERFSSCVAACRRTCRLACRSVGKTHTTRLAAQRLSTLHELAKPWGANDYRSRAPSLSTTPVLRDDGTKIRHTGLLEDAPLIVRSCRSFTTPRTWHPQSAHCIQGRGIDISWPNPTRGIAALANKSRRMRRCSADGWCFDGHYIMEDMSHIRLVARLTSFEDIQEPAWYIPHRCSSLLAPPEGYVPWLVMSVPSEGVHRAAPSRIS
jgi:hypothetical protein